jgi:hypothetical protein
MALSFSASIDAAHVRAATAGIFWRQALQPAVAAALVGLTALCQLLLYALVPGLAWPWHLAGALLMLGSFALLGLLVSRHYQGLALRNFAQFQDAPVSVNLDEAGYHYSARWGSGSIPWDQFQSLWRFPPVWVLLQHKQGGVSVLLPSGALDEEARAFIRARVKG